MYYLLHYMECRLIFVQVKPPPDCSPMEAQGKREVAGVIYSVYETAQMCPEPCGGAFRIHLRYSPPHEPVHGSSSYSPERGFLMLITPRCDRFSYYRCTFFTDFS